MQRLEISNDALGDLQSAEHSAQERLALEFAEAIHQNSNRVPEELYARLHQVFTDSELVELTFLIGFINMLNWFNNTLGVRYAKEFTDIEIK
jgi:alkylhydroperoxidase family enzyme